MQTVPVLIKVTFICDGIILFTGKIYMIPEDGDPVDLSGVRGHVRTVKFVSDSDEMCVEAEVIKCR